MQEIAYVSKILNEVEKSRKFSKSSFMGGRLVVSQISAWGYSRKSRKFSKSSFGGGERHRDLADFDLKIFPSPRACIERGEDGIFPSPKARHEKT